MTTPTPERALELAELLSAPEIGHDGMRYVALTQKTQEEVAAILRAYANMAPKWQAVLDAEPVKGICMHDDGVLRHYDKWNARGYFDNVHELIIKPTP